MAHPMFVDIARYFWFGVIGGISALFLFAMLLTGVFGPKALLRNTMYAYDCNGQHTWEPNECKNGVQLGNFNQTWYSGAISFESLNEYWWLSVQPYNRNSTSIDSAITVAVQVSASSTLTTPGQTQGEHIISSKTRSEVLECHDGASTPCDPFLLVYVNSINYPYYFVRFSFPDDDSNLSSKSAIGDVGFEFVTGNKSFSIEEITLRMIYLVIAIVLLGVFSLRMRKLPFSSWTPFQMGLGVMLLNLIILNDPFFPLIFLVPTPTFLVIDSIFEVFHACIIILFWLFIFDFTRKGNLSVTLDKWDIIKPVIVGIFAILCGTLFIWFNVQQGIDPVLKGLGQTSGIILLFYACALMYLAIIVWIMVLMFFTVPVVLAKRHLMARFAYTVIPSTIIILSILIGLFFGSFGPIRRGSAAFVYFYTLYNLYVWVLMAGYWPASTGFAPQTRTEGDVWKESWTDEDSSLLASPTVSAPTSPVRVASIASTSNQEHEFGSYSKNQKDIFGDDEAL